MANDVYTSPLASRYASPYMLHLFSPDSRFQTWRRLWVALARAQHQLGLPITARQVQELEAHVTDIDYEVAAAREREVRHDVMAHVYAYGKAAPSAAGILHLGATSCYVTDNADLILYRDGLRYLRGQLLSVLADLAAFARRYAAVPTLGYTHYQPAQPVTVGKRATLWMQDFLSDVEELDALLSGSSSPEDVPKGLQSRTLERIRTHLAQAPEEGCTCESLAAQAGLSSVTVRRYLTYLTQQGEVVSRVNYDTGGRPSLLYHLPKDRP